MASQLAWIGLGNMGQGMCKNLVEKGNLGKPLILYNRTSTRSQELRDKLGTEKTVVVESIADVVKESDIIFTCVGDDKAIEETIDTALRSNVLGKMFVDCSTVHPKTTESLAKKIIDKGAHFVASPVFGAPAMAEAGQLICVLAGPSEDVEKVKPYCKGVMGRAVVDYSGESYGKASTLKLIGNSFVLQMVEALSEGHTVAETSGLGAENLHKFIEVMFPGPYTAYSNRMLTGDYYGRDRPLFAIDLAMKDARHVLELANSSGAKMRAVEVANEHLAQVKEEKGASGDLAGIYGVARKEAGLPYENGKRK